MRAPPSEPPPPVTPARGVAVVTARTLTGRQPLIEVLRDGRVVGRGAEVELRLPPGEHVLEVRRSDAPSRSRERTVRIRAGETTRAKVLLD